MFPSNQNNQLSFYISSNPNQDMILTQMSHGGVDETSLSYQNITPNITRKCSRFSQPDRGNTSDDHNSKRVLHKDIERQRRREMAGLYTSLRNLLPLEYIKGKRATSDHIHETVKYIKDLQKKIKQLSSYRDGIIKDLSADLRPDISLSDESNQCSRIYVVVRSCFAGIEVVIASGFNGERVLHLSKVLKLLFEEGLDVVSCITAKVNQRAVCTIQSKVRYMTDIDISSLQNKIIEASRTP